jgi:hypothetical protein
MPKQLYKITQFHGGLNSSSDARDIAENELSEAIDVMVDELGKIRLMGGTSTSSMPAANIAAINAGYGLFQFSHDRTGAGIRTRHDGWHTGGDSATVLIDSAAGFTADLVGGTVYNITDGSTGTVVSVDSTTQITVDDLVGGTSDTFDDSDNDLYVVGWPETGDDYLAMADTDGAANIDIYSRVAGSWVAANIDLGDTTGIKPTFYAVDGALRVSDGNFGLNNKTKWYGYVHRFFFGDGTSGYDQDYYQNGRLISAWLAQDAAPTALTIQGFSTGEHDQVVDTVEAQPISIHLSMTPNYNFEDLTGGGSATTDTYTIEVDVDFLASNDTITASNHGSGSLTPGFDKFCSVGDRIIIFNSDASANNEVVHTVTAVDASSPNVITVGGSLTDSANNDDVQIHNLSRSEWFDVSKQGWEVAVSTLYDDSKQESALSISSTTLEPDDFYRAYSGGNAGYGMGSFKIMGLVWSAVGLTTGLPFSYPRVSGFNVYMRRTDGSDPDPWYLQATIDMTKGIKSLGGESYNMWNNSEWSEDDESAYCITESLRRPSTIITYEDNSEIDSTQTTVGFSGVGAGFKTAAISNRIAYVGNVKIKDRSGNLAVYGDAVLKSRVNRFDSFSLDRRIEASVNDGDAIIKLEAYADRLLIFKKKKLELLNISQEVEFLEDTFMHKGVSHPAATCKTDFGIAWVNEEGCYLYDGQKVNNLLEKGGRQIIKEGDWSDFVFNPMIGYIPKKRQLIVADDVGVDGTGVAYLYDIVTQSWVKSGAAAFPDADSGDVKTNFVTDWNNDLIFAYNTDVGTVVKWDDAADTSTTMVMSTKDIDFGNPGQKKTVYKVIVTYTTAASGSVTSNVQLDYGVNGDTTFAYDFTVPELPAANGWQTAELVPDVQSEASNIKSFRLRFATDGTVPAGFEINDVSIVYRLKGAR